METNSDLAMQILTDGPVAMYHNNAILDNDLKWFQANNYTVYDFDVSIWSSKQPHIDIKEKLEFPDYYGENMAAFNDCLGDMFPTDKRGIVLIFRHFNHYMKIDRIFCLDLLDHISVQSRLCLLNGQKLIGIVQSDDPWLEIEKIGGIAPIWNRQEWFNTDRVKE